MGGGYDEGYKACPCFWGNEPGSLITRLETILGDFSNLSVLDAGCGEGKNSAYIARREAKVHAIDVSEIGLRNAKEMWANTKNITWEIEDVCSSDFEKNKYHVIIAYGLLHCLSSDKEIEYLVRKFQAATKQGGYHVICSFNDRHQDLSAHPNFHPTLAKHDFYINLYDGWDILYDSNEILEEIHPHNNIKHSHSLTRLIARNGANK